MGLFFDELGSQGTIGEPFKKAFAEKSMAQGTIEYLVVIGAVVVVALVTVSVLADFSDVSSSVDGLRSIDDLVGTYGLSVRDAVADGDRLFFNLRNSSSDFYDVVGLEVGGVKRVYSSRVGAGASRTFVFNEAPGSCVCSGGSSRVSCPVGVSFVSRNNVERFEFLDLSFECLDYVQFSDSVVDGVKAITTCEELQAMNEDLSGDYVLGGNVDCSGTVSWNGDEGFVPIGNFSNRFRGSFDGQDFNITGLFIDRSSSDQGLFGYADGASIKNVGLVDVDITGDGTVGGLVGRMSNSSIVGSFSSGEVSGFSSVGGLVGLMNNSSIVGSFSSGVVSGSGWNSGGLVGQMGTSSVVRDSFSMGDVSGNNAVGGLVGLMNNSSIVGSFSSGVVSGSGNGVGGLVGQMGTSSVMDSFSMGDVSGNNSVGGLVGSMSGFSVVSDSFSSGVVSGSGWNIGGLVGRLVNSSVVSDSFSSGVVSGSGNGVGGLVGRMEVSSVVGSFSSGDVSGSGSVGGLVGGIFDGGEVVNSFSLGDVSGSGSVGGLVGEIRYDYASTLFLISVVNSYSIGEVSGSSNIGGLVGVLFEDTVSFSNVFFDSSVSGVVDAVGSVEEGTGGMSCPFLYTWNGVEFEFIADVGGGGGLLYSSPWTPGGVGNPDEYGVPRRPKEASNVDFMHVTDDQLQAKDGKYVFVLREDLDEVNYMDMVELFVVDHPKDVSVFSPVFNGMGLWVDRNFEDMLGLTIKEPISPVSAFDSFGNDVLRKVLWVDGDYVVGRALEWDTLTVDFGDLSDANQIKLLFNGFNAFASSDDYSERFGYLMSNPDEPFYMYAYPFAEVRDADGEWVYAPEPEQLFHAHGYARTNVWDITHWFEVNDFTDFSIRINTHHKVMIDYVAVDISDDVDVNITKVKPSSAVLKEFGIAANRFSPVFDEVRDSDIPVDGNFTRLGDVLELVLDTDDRFVVMKPGDGVVFEFDEVEKQVGMGRSYFVHQTGYYKGYEIVKRLGKDVLEVDPLPFNDMAYYHLDIESPYLGDVVYQEYLDVWNTREVVSGEGEVIFGDLSDSVSGVSGLFFSGFSGVFGRPSSDMVKRNTFVGWDFYDVWDIVDGVSYPFLRNNVPSVIPMPQ